MSDRSPPDHDLTRRGLLDRLLGSAIAASLLGAAAPVIGYLSPLPKRVTAGAGLTDASGRPIPPSDVTDATGVVGSLGGKPVLVVRRGGRLLGFEAVCPHLGCIVQWNARSERIACPCHGGQFDLTGAVTSGPPQRGLTPVDLRVDNDRIRRA